MIIARLFGGLGNQLFIFAFGYALSKELNQKLILDVKSGFKNDSIYNRKYILNYLKIDTRIASNRLSHRAGLIPRKILKNNELISSLCNICYLTDKNLTNLQLEKLKNRNMIYIDGYFQSYEYFNKYYQDIIELIDLNFESAIKMKSINLLKNDKQNVCIHYRSYSDIPISIRKNNQIIDGTYYKHAIEYFQKRGNYNYYVFSDNILKAREVLNFIDFTFVENDDSILPREIIDFALMQNCDHFIIANSTFSWWAAYSNNRVNKVVIRPTYNYYRQFKNFYVKSWLTI